MLLIIGLNSIAQKPIIITIDTPITTVNKENKYTVDIPEVKLDDIKKDWMVYGDNVKSKMDFVNGDYIQTACENINFSPLPFSAYSQILETKTGVRITYWIVQNSSITATELKNKNTDLAIQKYLYDFAIIEYKDFVSKDLKLEQHKLSTMENDLAMLNKDEDKSTKTINMNNRDNVQSKEEIKGNNTDINNTTDQINDQKTMVVVTTPDPNAHKGAKKTLNQMEDNKTALVRDNKMEQKNIDQRNIENHNENRNKLISQTNSDQLTKSIESQKEIIRTIQMKLDNIK